MSKNVFIVMEQRDGEIQKVSLELLGKGSHLAKELGQDLVAVLLGDNIKGKSELLIQYGADKVIVAEDPMLKEYTTEPYTKTIAHVIRTYDPEIVLFGATSIGRDLAPRVSARIHTGLTADCTKLDIDEETKGLLMTRPAFGGNIMATIICPNYRPQMATVRPGVMETLEKDKARKGEVDVINMEFTAEDEKVKIREVIKKEKNVTDIISAKILVSAGRGVGKPENLQNVKAVADALDGEMSASRAVVDAGWLDKEHQVGQTGKTVRPDLYLACGISGAIQHVAGMEGSELIIAINKNESAPIFDVADLGVVGDVNVILPKLAEGIKKAKEKKAMQ